MAMILFFCSPFCRGQEVKDVFADWNYLDGANTWLYKYLAGQAFDQLKARKSAVSKINSKEEWLQRQSWVRKAYSTILGPFPPKTTLNAVVTGVLETGYAKVEKLHFESMPGYQVTAALFLPVNRKGKVPAILYCSGHSGSGFRSKAYQHVILNLVKKGFAVLAFDPIGQGERRQFLSSESRKLFSTTQDHSYPGNQVFLTGRSPAYYFIWDAIRAIDYLCSRPEIDTTRIGVTGRSGGGTQTAYIAAFDKRVKAAAPECYTTSYEKLLLSRGPQDAEQNLVNSISAGLDITDLLVCFAPKPMLIISTTRDIFSIQGTRDVFNEIKPCYSYLGKPASIAMVEDDAEHASTKNNRQAMYQFFQQHLTNPGSPEDEAVATFDQDELKVTTEGNVYTSLKGHNLQTLSKDYLATLLNKKIPVAAYDDLKKRISQVIKMNPLPVASSPVFSGRYVKTGYNVYAYLLKGIAGYLPLYWLKPNTNNPKSKVVLLLDDRGKREAIKAGGLADSLALEGYQVVVPDLSGFGELANGFIKGGDAYVDKVPLNLWYTCVLTHQSLLSVRLGEIFILLNWMKTAGLEINGIARGTLTTELLHAAVMRSGDFKELVCIDPLISYQSVVETQNYKTSYILSAVPGMIGRYDMYDLINYMPRHINLLCICPRDGSGQVTTGAGKDGRKPGLKLPANVKLSFADSSCRQVDYWFDKQAVFY